MTSEADYDRTVAQLAETQEKYDKLKGDRYGLQEKLDQARHELEHVSKNYAVMQLDLEKKTRALIDLRNRVNGLKKNRDDYGEELLELQATRDRLKEEAHQKSQVIGQLTSQLQQCEGKYNRLILNNAAENARLLRRIRRQFNIIQILTGSLICMGLLALWAVS